MGFFLGVMKYVIVSVVLMVVIKDIISYIMIGFFDGRVFTCV